MGTFKKYVTVIAVAISILLLATLITETAYNISPFEYWQDSVALNSWEKTYLEDKGSIRYGLSSDSEPLAFTNESGETGGIMMDYISLLSIEMGVPVEVQVIQSRNKALSLDSNNIDTTDLFASNHNKRKYICTQEIFRLEGAVLKRSKDTSILRVRNLRRKNVAVVSGDYGEAALMERFDDGEINIKRVNSIDRAMKFMEEGSVDAVVGDRIVMQDYLNNTPNLKSSYTMLEDVIYSKRICLFLDKDDKILRGILNKSILSIKKKNLLPQIADKWVGSSGMVVSDWNNYRYLPYLALAIVMLAVWSVLIERMLRRRINLATEEIQDQKDSLRTVIDSMDLSLFVLNEENQVVECNEKAVKLTALDYDKIAGKNIEELPVIGQIYGRYRNSGSSNIKLGDKIYNMVTRFMSEHRGNRLLICEDITEKTMVQRELSQKNKMAAVGQLSAGLAHEIRNPLGLIKNYGYIIDGYANDDLSRHAVSVIDESVQRINLLIENLLNYSRLGNDKTARINIEETVNNLLILEKKKAMKAGIDFTIDIEKDLTLVTNVETFRIVISNLVNNGIEAFENHEAENKSLKLQICRENEFVVVRVSDNGPGIGADKIENVFNPFYTTKDEGTGLGLYVVSTELEKIGGTITVSSVENEKTEFEAKFPVMSERDNDEE